MLEPQGMDQSADADQNKHHTVFQIFCLKSIWENDVTDLFMAGNMKLHPLKALCLWPYLYNHFTVIQVWTQAENLPKKHNFQIHFLESSVTLVKLTNTGIILYNSLVSK